VHSVKLLTIKSIPILLPLLLLQPFYGSLFRTTQMSRYQKNHTPTHVSWSSSNLLF